MQQHGRPATVVFDHIEEIFMRDPPFLDVLQGFAEKAAEARTLRVVFVSSAYSVLAHMSTDMTRGAKYEVVPVTEQDAITYLVNKFPKMAHSVADYIVKNVTGTSFLALTRAKPD
eukprot:GDKI01044234.1.p3 GENE.GDKI01044234.1~~GDKI01044234.1.p3  ORF type:complete len:115 (+),score=31.05 GDKI01044234.1:480-824(+)